MFVYDNLPACSLIDFLNFFIYLSIHLFVFYEYIFYISVALCRRSKATSGEDPSGLLSSSCSSLSSKSKSMNLEDRSASLRFEAAEGPAPLDVLLRGSVTPIIPSLAAGGAAAAAAAWKASNNSCHAAPAAAAAAAGAAASGVRLTSPSRPLGSRSRNDV